MLLSNSRPTTSETRALSGTAETPALPMSGLILLPSFRNRLKNFTNSTPPQVAITNEIAPSTKMPIDLAVRKVVACVEAPTVKPIRIVTMSMSGPFAVSAKRLVTVLSFSRLPKNNIPSSGRPDGTRRQVVFAQIPASVVVNVAVVVIVDAIDGVGVVQLDVVGQILVIDINTSVNNADDNVGIALCNLLSFKRFCDIHKILPAEIRVVGNA